MNAGTSAGHEREVPYPGLRPFEREEAVLFFGRDDCVDAMVETLQRKHFLAVLGASGSGKSSLVRTGLFEALDAALTDRAGSRWMIADIRHPGGMPFRELAKALLAAVGASPTDEAVTTLRDELHTGPRKLIDWWKAAGREPDEKLLILVDQFEELFRYRSPGQRDDVEFFIDLLLASAATREAPIYIVITMRSEYLGVCSLISGLAEQINQSLSLTPRMKWDECEAAIVGPSRIIGFTVEDKLVNALLNDMNTLAPFDEDGSGASRQIDQSELIARRADQLPLMQHVLNLLWMDAIRGRKTGEPVELTLKAYHDLKGLQGALTKHADEVMASTRDPELTAKIFKALTDGTTVAGAVRRQLSLKQLIAETGANETAVRAVVDKFRARNANFLTPALPEKIALDDKVDISHESLIRQWTSLSSWLKQEVKDAETWRALQRASRRRAEDGLIVGSPLRFYQDWMSAFQPTIAWTDRYDGGYEQVQAFLKDSEAEDLRARRRRQMALAAGIAALVAIPTGVYAYVGWQAVEIQADADEQAARKISRAEVSAQQRVVAANAQALTIVREVRTRARREAKAEVEAARNEAQALIAATEHQLMAMRAATEQRRQQTVQIARTTADMFRRSVAADLARAFRPEQSRIVTMGNLADSRETLRELMTIAERAGLQTEVDFAAVGAKLQLANIELFQGELMADQALVSAYAASDLARLAPMQGAPRDESRALQAVALAQQGRTLQMMPGQQQRAATAFREALALATSQPAQLPMVRPAAFAYGGLARIEAAEGRIDEATALADQCLAFIRQYEDRSSQASSTEIASEPSLSEPASQAPSSRIVSPGLAFESRLSCLRPLLETASTEEEVEELFEAREGDLEIIRELSDGVVREDIRLMRGWSEFVLRLADIIPVARTIYATMLVGQYPSTDISDMSISTSFPGLSGSGQPAVPGEPLPDNPYENWYLGDLLTYSRLRSMQAEDDDTTEADRISNLYPSAQAYNAIWLRLEEDEYPGEEGIADRAASEFVSQLQRVRPDQAQAGGIDPEWIRAQARALELATSSGARIGRSAAAIHPHVREAALRLTALLARPEVRTELRRYPNLSEITPEIMFEAARLCVALQSAQADPCFDQAVDLPGLYASVQAGRSSYEAALEQAQSTADMESLEVFGVTPMEAVYQGIDPVACVEDIENGRNLAQAPDGLASDGARICTLQRGFGDYALVDNGQVWLFTTEPNMISFRTDPARYRPAVAPSASISGSTDGSRAGGGFDIALGPLRFGRLVNGRLRLYVSYVDAVNDRTGDAAVDDAP